MNALTQDDGREFALIALSNYIEIYQKQTISYLGNIMPEIIKQCDVPAQVSDAIIEDVSQVCCCDIFNIRLYIYYLH